MDEIKNLNIGRFYQMLSEVVLSPKHHPHITLSATESQKAEWVIGDSKFVIEGADDHVSVLYRNAQGQVKSAVVQEALDMSFVNESFYLFTQEHAEYFENRQPLERVDFESLGLGENDEGDEFLSEQVLDPATVIMVFDRSDYSRDNITYFEVLHNNKTMLLDNHWPVSQTEDLEWFSRWEVYKTPERIQLF